MSASRRKFLQQLGSTALFYGAGSLERLQAEERYDTRMLQYERKYTANDAIRVAVVGTGIMGHNDLASALKVPGVSLAGACDLYNGRLTRMKELYGKDLFVTQDYRELLLRKDIDAIIIATSDHHHARISTDALKAGKHVYCEKPMVHQLSQGLGVINTWKASGKTMQVGSQGISGLDFAKARELYRSGAIGQLNCIEAFTDRQSALGAWQYTLPTDASAATVDWDKYIAGMPKQAFDPMKFFRWRNYKEFGTGMSGDLFVHLLTGIHFITGSHGPSKIMANVMYNDFYKFVRRYPLVFKNRIKFLERSYQKNIAFFGIDKGYSPFFPDPNVKIENYRDTIEADDLDYFERFVDLCNRNHIKLYLFRAPILECERSDSREFDEYIHAFTQKNNIPYLDLKCEYQIHSQYWTQTHPADSLANLISKDVEKFLLKYKQ